MKLCGFEAGLDRPFFLIAGTCSIEGLQMSLDVAGQLKETCTALGIPLIYKGSFDKANRSSGSSQRGVGLDAGLKILDEVRRQLGVPILTDVHDEAQVAPVAAVVDVLQTPAFLCRQTDFIRAVAQSGKPVNIKKGQFLAPWDMKNEDNFLACERGVSFGYNNLVADMTSLAEMRQSGAPVVFDVTHSVQKPGGLGAVSGGAREMVPVLARAGVAAGVAGLFMETHPCPSEAWSDGPNAVPLHRMKALLETLVTLDAAVKKYPLLENDFT
jgi:2-dehydro-3-deoxyphosphooctonate aldolase (KDO 8-P synthase)